MKIIIQLDDTVDHVDEFLLRLIGVNLEEEEEDEQEEEEEEEPPSIHRY